MCDETGFNTFPPELLPKTLDDLKSAIEASFAKIYNSP
jgi:hypothetical protein